MESYGNVNVTSTGRVLTVETGVLRVVRVRIVLEKLGMRTPCESAQPTTARRRVVRHRPTDEAELVQTSATEQMPAFKER